MIFQLLAKGGVALGARRPCDRASEHSGPGQELLQYRSATLRFHDDNAVVRTDEA